MGKRGPVATPTNVLQLRGSRWGKARANSGEPQVEVTRPRAPKRLSNPAKKVWTDLVERLGPDGLRVMTDPDVYALGRLCELQALFDQLVARLYQKDPESAALFIVVTDDSGQAVGYKERPENGLLLRIEEKLDRAYAKFGLTPSDRVRVKAAAPEPQPTVEEGTL